MAQAGEAKGPDSDLVPGIQQARPQRLELGWDYMWKGVSGGEGVVPLKIILENNGRPDRGEIVVSTGRSRVRVPFESPSGTKREYPVYAVTDQYGGSVEVRLNGQIYRQSTMINPDSAGGQGALGVISDVAGRFSLNQGGPPNQPDPLRGRGGGPAVVGYAKPREAPERAVGYQPMDAVVLSEGAERITDAEASALKRWVVSGGTLIFPVGSHTSAVNDSRWSGWLPVAGARAGLAPMPGAWQSRGAPSQPLSWASATVLPGARTTIVEGRLERASRTVGLGRVVFLAWNPAEQPLRSWPGRVSMVRGLVDNALMLRTRARSSYQPLTYSHAFFGADNINSAGFGSSPWSATATGAGAPPGAVPRAVGGPGTDPFEIQPPSPGLVFLILAAYWVVVVPIHFIVLGKLGKSNWAWITAPVVALGFAFIFFSFAAGLYRAGTARTQTGVLFAAEDKPEALFVGAQQVFFARAGSYNLKMTGVEAVFPASQNYGFPEADVSFQPDTIDTGEITIPRASVGSLAFRDLAIQQAAAWPGGIVSRSRVILRNGGTAVVGEIEYRGGPKLDNIIIKAGQAQAGIGQLAPGQTKQFDIPLNRQAGASHDLVLEAVLLDQEFGITTGTMSSRRNRVTLVLGLKAPAREGEGA